MGGNYCRNIFIGLSFFCCVLIPIEGISQSLNSNQGKGIFLAKCYAMGVFVMTDDEATQKEKERVGKWAMNVSGASEKFIEHSLFEDIAKKELYRIAKGDKSYLLSQIDSCTKTLGRW